jgi:hypothetical protein
MQIELKGAGLRGKFAVFFNEVGKSGTGREYGATMATARRQRSVRLLSVLCCGQVIALQFGNRLLQVARAPFLVKQALGRVL